MSKRQRRAGIALPRPGAAIRALGLFDVPLCPVVFSRSEGRPAIAELVGFLVSQATMVDSDALPLGWIQDNTEKMWGSMVHVATKLLHTHVAAGRIRVSEATKEAFGFYIGVDPKHVEWRLQDALDSRSGDFLHAGWALRTLFSHLFNVKVETTASGSNAADRDHVGDDSGEGAERQQWQESWEAFVMNGDVRSNVAAGKCAYAAFRRCLDGKPAAGDHFRHDQCLPPRALVYNVLGLLGCKEEQRDLWDGKAVADLYLEELTAFTRWFSTAMVP